MTAYRGPLFRGALMKDTKFHGIKIWFNLRSHNKVWTNQVEGVKIICEYILEKYQNVTFVFDGLPDCPII